MMLSMICLLFAGIMEEHYNAAISLFVMNNRSHSFTDYSNPECNLDNKYDIVVGPVVDDDMAMLFRQYQNELITFENLINGMTFRKTTNQYSFHTDRAIALLRKAGVDND